MNHEKRKEEMRYRVAHHQHLLEDVFAPTDSRWRHINRLGLGVLLGSSDQTVAIQDFDVEYREDEINRWHPFLLINRTLRCARLGDLEMLRKEFVANVSDDILTMALALLTSMADWTFYRCVPQNEKETSYEFFCDLKGVSSTGLTIELQIVLVERQDRWFIEDIQARN